MIHVLPATKGLFGTQPLFHLSYLIILAMRPVHKNITVSLLVMKLLKTLVTIVIYLAIIVLVHLILNVFLANMKKKTCITTDA